MHIQFTPFHGTDIDEAAELLARRHRENRAAEPLLPERYTEPEIARAAVEKTWSEAHHSGVVARQGARMVGYLIGVPRTGGFWGRSAWVELAGHAVDHTLGAEVYRDLYADMYAALSPSWVALGLLAHYILIPEPDHDALEAWFSLSFGKEQVHGLRETAPVSAFALPANPEYDIRRATLSDMDMIVDLENILPTHQSLSPVYAPRIPYDREQARQELIAILKNEKEKLWLAYEHGLLAGYQLFAPAAAGHGTADMLITPDSSYLAIAVTREEERRRGVGRSLAAHGLASDYTDGYTHCLIDWRATNLLASRFWLRQGFRPVAYRLSRRLDERILWAHGSHSPAPWLPPGSNAIPFTVGS